MAGVDERGRWGCEVSILYGVHLYSGIGVCSWCGVRREEMTVKGGMTTKTGMTAWKELTAIWFLIQELGKELAYEYLE